MEIMNARILDRFREALGPLDVITDQDDLAPWLADWRGVYAGQAGALLSPRSVEQVAAIMRIAREEGVSLVPQGGNTSMVGGATPRPEGVNAIVSTRKMNRIRSLDRDANIVIAEAGVVLQTLHEAALAQGRRFPLSLGAKGSATIGGLVSTNAGGTQVLRFGTMRALTLGIEAVLPDGSLFEGLAPLKKDTRGYDPRQLLVGAEGTLGIVTAAALKLVPAPLDVATAWVGLRNPHQALSLLRFLENGMTDAIESFELVPEGSLALVLDHIADTRRPLAGPHPWHVLVEAVLAEGASAVLTDWLGRAAEAGLIEDAVIASSEAQAASFWKLRESISAAERAEGPAMQHDISVPVDAMPDFLEAASRAVEARFPGVTARGYGHLGDGNIHFHVCAPHGVDAAGWRADPGKAISNHVYDLVTAANGSISAEHGIGQMKIDAFARLAGPARLAVIHGVKRALDPLGIMNPGKLVPLAIEPPAA